MRDLTSAQLRELGEAIGRGAVRELLRGERVERIVWTLLGMDPMQPAHSVKQWMRALGEGVRGA